ncbi:Uncharacterized protein BP5553_07807 [Venustampulla echinocandica]|uniref:Uncharacterized protein n=1 Tax=Venustampulla echinocandica TaxID=2656787 RepID=A0A370THK3_9HELO|nr:Uncharacterized protein BP5553_07807 [Venustampulla echinocandica]RDL34679.1 Uncharacterized protein BP5553_07807 [Venustampulla echinocandica]
MKVFGFNIPNIAAAVRNVFQRPSHKDSTTTLPRPPSIEWLLNHRDIRRPQTRGDTPAASLYRMYEYTVLGYNTGLRTEIESFFNHPNWLVADIPDPKDPDPARYAILAVLPQFLVEAFNRLIRRGLPRNAPTIIAGDAHEAELRAMPIVLERMPPWAEKVPKLKEPLIIPNSEGGTPDEKTRSPKYLKMNLIIEEPSVFFV